MNEWLRTYMKGVYRYTVDSAYAHAYAEIAGGLVGGGLLLDCGCQRGQHLQRLEAIGGATPGQYVGLEWDREGLQVCLDRGLPALQGDLNAPLPFRDQSFSCVMALSVLEHLLHGCAWIQEARRVLRPGGRLVILTPNISTFFTVALLLAGKMPSSGPHPDSETLIRSETVLQVARKQDPQIEGDRPVDRHLVVFSYRVLKRYLKMCGFQSVYGRGFGLYPFPVPLQPLLQRIDPIHCHQMVFTATR